MTTPMPTKPLLSVVVPIYNVEAYLDRCITSIVSQTYDNLDIILVDDVSPDRCPAICDEWAKRDERIRVVHKAKNGGLGLARNSGMEVARGEYITFVDSDDYIDIDMYAVMMAKAMEVDADIVSCGLHRQNADGTFTDVIDFKEDTVIRGREAMDELAKRYLVSPTRIEINLGVWHCVYRKSITDHLFLSERVCAPEDISFQVECAHKANCYAYVARAFYYYMYNIGGLCRTYTLKNVAGFVACAEHLRDLFAAKGVHAIAEPYIFTKIYYFLRAYLSRKNVTTAQRREMIDGLLSYEPYQQMISSADIHFGSGLKSRYKRMSYRLQRGRHRRLFAMYMWLDRKLIAK